MVHIINLEFVGGKQKLNEELKSAVEYCHGEQLTVM